MKKHLVMAVVPLLALGCGEELKDENGDGIADGVRNPDNVTVVTPATPKGTASGQVLSTDLRPLTDVTVEMTVGSSADPRTATTDAKGNFEFTDVPAGSQILLTFSKAGYATLRATSLVPSSAGNVPINNGNASFGPITLAKLDGSLRFIVVTPQGRPAVGARATLEASPAGDIVLANDDENTQVVKNVVVEGTVNEQGALVFEGIPSATELARLNGAYRLWVAPMDANSDGIPETGGYNDSYAGSTVVANSTPRIINLPYSRPGAGAFIVENTNVGSLRGSTDLDPLRNMLRPSEPIYLFFNQPVQQNSLLVRLTDEYARESLPVQASVSNGGYTATITPSSGVVQAGREYNIDMRAVSAEGGTIFNRTGFFFGGEVGSPQAITVTDVRYQETSTTAPSSSQINPGERVYVYFSSPISRMFSIPGSGPYVQVFVNANVGDASATSVNFTGDYPGELGNPTGFDLFMDEPTAPLPTRTPAETPAFQINGSNYSTRYSFVYNGAFPLSPNNLTVQVAFSKLPSRYINGTYESVWGQPITADLTVTTVGVHPVPTP